MEKNRSPLVKILPDVRNAKKPMRNIVGSASGTKNPGKTRTRSYTPKHNPY